MFSIISNPRYLKDPWNYVDWMAFILSLIYFIDIYVEDDSDWSHGLAPFLLVIVFYRNFSQIRVISYFNMFVGIINIIIQKLIVFFLILFYFYLTTSLLMVYLFREQDVKTNFQIAYLWTLFGGFFREDYYPNYAVVAILFSSLIVTVLLLNILIAYLSNLFSRLEEQQHVNDLKEKAGKIGRAHV